MTLTAEHHALLTQGSGITEDIIAERGYRTCTGYSELKSLGIVVRRDTDTKGLLIPLYTVEGKPGETYIAREDRCVPLMVYRPNSPEVDHEGHARKYLYPGGQRMRLDCLPRCQRTLGDPTVPLYVTEGMKKADALASHGCCALALLGVWNWRGTNTEGGKTALQDWQHVALQGREVRLVFDSDLAENPKVHAALEALADFLSAKGATVHIAYLPSAEGQKVGVDDYLLTHTIADLERLLEAPRRTTPKAHQAIPSLKLNRYGEVRPVLFNVLEILTHDQRWAGVFGYDAFARVETLRIRPPYLTGDEPWTVRPIQDNDDKETSNWLQREYDLCAATSLIAEAIQVLAHRNPYHPVRDYLRELTWDGIPRLDTWLVTYCHAEDTMYNRVVGRKTLLSGVARVEQPGCKADCVAILQGEQGTGKSTTWRTLAGNWFSDTMPDIERKDAMESLHGMWIVELGEMAVLQRSEREAIKRFVSAASDHYRPSYGRRAVTFPRETVFVGSTNKEQIFQDETGNRRFWPVKVQGQCDIAALQRDRDQLWAEAYAQYRAGAIWHLTPAEDALAVGEQEERFEVDPWEERVLAYVGDEKDQVSTQQIMEEGFQWDNPALWTMANSKRIGAILRRHGWRHQTCRDTEGRPFKGFKRVQRVTAVTTEPAADDTTGYGAISRKNNAVTAVTAVTATCESIEAAYENDEKEMGEQLSTASLANRSYTGHAGYSGYTPATTPPNGTHNGLSFTSDCMDPPCFACRGTVFWRNEANERVCSRCHPQPTHATKGVLWSN